MLPYLIIIILSMKLENLLSGATLHLTSINHHAFIAASVSNCFAILLALTIIVTGPEKTYLYITAKTKLNECSSVI